MAMLGGILIIIVCISALSLFTNTVNRFILLISPRILDIGCAGTVLFLIGLNVFRKTWVEIKTRGRIDAFRWLGLLIATLLFIGFYQIIDTINTLDQYVWGFILFLLLGIISTEFFPHSSNIDDDEDDYHAPRPPAGNAYVSHLASSRKTVDTVSPTVICMEEKMLSIRSTSSDRELVFSPCENRDHYHAKIKSFSISASVDIPYAVGESLSDFFRQLASHKSPWSVPQEWHSCTYDPPDLKISATCTNRGHVRFQIILFAGYYNADFDAENWEANIGLETTLGELDNIARHARTFFQERTSDT